MLDSTIAKKQCIQNRAPRNGFWAVPISESQILRQDRILKAVNSVALQLFSHDNLDFEKNIESALGIMGRSVNTEQVIIWRNYSSGNNVSIYRYAGWDRPGLDIKFSGSIEKPAPADFSFEDIIPNWGLVMEEQNPVYYLDKNLHEPFRSIALNNGIRSVLLLPIFLRGNNWGFITFLTYSEERFYSNPERELLRTGGILLASAIENNNSLNELSRARDEAQINTEAKSDFLSNMSHELRTPLNAIIGMTKIAKMSPEKGKYCLEKIETSSKHLLGIINDVLDISKIEANKVELEEQEFNFEDMIRNAFDLIRVKADEKTLKLEKEGEAFKKLIVGDELRFSQVLLNLLSNAAKFTPEGGTVSLKYNSCETIDGVMLRVEVKDSGIGMSEDQLQKLFKPFAQAEKATTRKYGGTGLGLAISKKIIKMMGGDIWVESKIGQGTSFIFVVEVGWGKPVPAEEKDAEISQIPQWQGKTILAVEDVEINQEIINSLLEKTGVTIEEACNGAEAVAKFGENPGKYDLILMDVQMPEMNGLDATRAIRKIEAGIKKYNNREISRQFSGLLEHTDSDALDILKASPKLLEYLDLDLPENIQYREVPIIAMTANVFTQDIKDCLDAGMNAHLAKPVEMENLINTMRVYLG